MSRTANAHALAQCPATCALSAQLRMRIRVLRCVIGTYAPACGLALWTCLLFRLDAHLRMQLRVARVVAMRASSTCAPLRADARTACAGERSSMTSTYFFHPPRAMALIFEIVLSSTSRSSAVLEILHVPAGWCFAFKQEKKLRFFFAWCRRSKIVLFRFAARRELTSCCLTVRVCVRI